MLHYTDGSDQVLNLRASTESLKQPAAEFHVRQQDEMRTTSMQ